MSAETASIASKTKSDLNKGQTPVQQSPFENVNQYGITNLECLMCYIGSKYPHFKRTILPVALVVSFLSAAQNLLLMSSTPAHAMEISEQYRFFVRTGNHQKAGIRPANDTNVELAYPPWELALYSQVVGLSMCTLVSPRSVVLVSVAANCLSMLASLYTDRFLTFNLFVAQIFLNMLKAVSSCMILESVPKYHRLAAIGIFELVSVAFSCAGLVLFQLSEDSTMSIDSILIFNVAVSVICVYVVYYTFHDSLFSLLALSKFDKLQEELARIFKISNITLPADAVIDSFAFDNFDDNNNALEIFIKSIKSFKIIQETVVTGILLGINTMIQNFLASEIIAKQTIKDMDLKVVNMVPGVLSCLVLVVMAFITPNHRIVPLMGCNGVLFICVAMICLISTYGNRWDLCSGRFIINEESSYYHFVFAMLGTTTTVVNTHLLSTRLREVMPSLIRIPTAIIAVGVSFSFSMNIAELLFTNKIDPFMILAFVSISSMLFILLIPRKGVEMSVYFSEIIASHRNKKTPPVPLIEGK